MKKVIRATLPIVVILGLCSGIGCRNTIERKGSGIVDTTRVVQTVKPKIASKAVPFDLEHVRLLDGPFKDAMERDRKYLDELDSDRLLHMFRVTAGLPSTAQPLGGWENPSCEIRGHTLGHYLSACALMVASTGDGKLKEKADAIVAELAKCQQAMPGQGYHPGYLFAFPESFFDRVDNLQPVWVPWYTCHKIMAGLLDMYIYCGNEQALEVLKKMAAWAKMRTDRLTEDNMQKAINLEFGGMNDVLTDLYAVTGDPDHLTVARRFDHKAFYGPLEKHEDRLQGLHSNTNIPKAVGAAAEYEMTGDERYREIASFFWDAIVDGRMFATGGTSNYEAWRTAPGVLASEISVESQETCCTYNMLKLTRHLFEWTADVRYADYYERALINSILATQSPENGMMMYYVAMKPGHWKVFNLPNDSFWCCTGTWMENHAKYVDSIYFHGGDTLYVNLFIASELNWAEKGIRIRQETRFPDEDRTSLTVKAARPATFAMNLRVPYWATNGAFLKVNGRPESVTAKPGSYLTVRRKWKDGDRIELTLPMSLRIQPMPDDPELVAFMYGPLILAGALGTEKLTRDMQYLADQRAMHNGPSIAVSELVLDPRRLGEVVQPVAGEGLTFRTVGIGRPTDVTLVPYHKLFFERYAIYWRTYATEETYLATEAKRKAEAEARREKEEARRRLIEERAVDQVEIGVEASERAHEIQRESSFQGAVAGGNWRDAREDGWFSYTVKVLPDRPTTLLLTYWGNDAGRSFRILIDDKELVRATIEGGHANEFFDVEYKIPLEMTQGKERVAVKLQADSNGLAGGIFGLVTMKEKR
jgi:DUF1680 family protein